jgi:hypothetical protein
MKWSRLLEDEARAQTVLWGWQVPDMSGQRSPLAAATEATSLLEVGGYGLSGY